MTWDVTVCFSKKDKNSQKKTLNSGDFAEIFNIMLFFFDYAFYAIYAFFPTNQKWIQRFWNTGNSMNLATQGVKCIMLYYAFYAFGLAWIRDCENWL